MPNFDRSFTASGYQPVATSQALKLPSDYMAFYGSWSGNVVSAGEIQLGGRRAEAQIHDLPRGYLILARIDGAPAGAAGTLISNALYGLVGTFAKLPLPLRIFSFVVGSMVGPMAAPAVAFLGWLANNSRRGGGQRQFPQLAVGQEFRLKYHLWGRSEDQVRRAFPPGLQAAVLSQGFSGGVTVGPEGTFLEVMLPSLGARKALEHFLLHDLPAIGAAV
jgi:hypothetical protein